PSAPAHARWQGSAGDARAPSHRANTGDSDGMSRHGVHWPSSGAGQSPRATPTSPKTSGDAPAPVAIAVTHSRARRVRTHRFLIRDSRRRLSFFQPEKFGQRAPTFY